MPLTPQTDLLTTQYAEWEQLGLDDLRPQYIALLEEHARQLERELSQANAILAYLRSMRAGEMGERLYRLENELAALKATP